MGRIPQGLKLNRKELCRRQADVKETLHHCEMKLRKPFFKDEKDEKHYIKVYQAIKIALRNIQSQLLKSQEELRG